MNLALKGLHGKPLTIEDFEPYKIVSLWDMLRFYAEKYIQLLTFLNEMKAICDSSSDPDAGISLAKKLQPLKPQLEWLHQDLIFMNLTASVSSVRKLLQQLDEQNWIWGAPSPSPYIKSLIDNVVAELGGHIMLRIPLSRARYYKKAETILGANMIRDFPALEDDAIEAGNCYALGRFSACVFHLMRIMEYTVRKFAEKVKDIPFDVENDSWGPILDRISKEIEKNENKFPARSSKKKKYRACCDSMNGLRPRRNGLMHHGQHYSAERALDIIGAVKACMDQYLELPNIEGSGE